MAVPAGGNSPHHRAMPEYHGRARQASPAEHSAHFAGGRHQTGYGDSPLARRASMASMTAKQSAMESTT